MIQAEPLKIEKCGICGHDIMANGELVKHTNVQDGHRFFTLYCQECECSTPIVEEKKELKVEVRNGSTGERVRTRDEIEKLLGEGKTNREICKLLDLASSTVSYHVSAIKAAASSREKKNAGDLEQIKAENAVVEKLNEEINRLRAENEKLLHAATPPMNGTLKSRVEISCFEGYYDTQKKLISETVKEEIYHASKGKTITMEVRKFPDRTRVTVEISGMEAPA